MLLEGKKPVALFLDRDSGAVRLRPTSFLVGKGFFFVVGSETGIGKPGSKSYFLVGFAFSLKTPLSRNVPSTASVTSFFFKFRTSCLSVCLFDALSLSLDVSG